MELLVHLIGNKACLMMMFPLRVVICMNFRVKLQTVLVMLLSLRKIFLMMPPVDDKPFSVMIVPLLVIFLMRLSHLAFNGLNDLQ